MNFFPLKNFLGSFVSRVTSDIVFVLSSIKISLISDIILISSISNHFKILKEFLSINVKSFFESTIIIIYLLVFNINSRSTLYRQCGDVFSVTCRPMKTETSPPRTVFTVSVETSRKRFYWNDNGSTAGKNNFTTVFYEKYCELVSD